MMLSCKIYAIECILCARAHAKVSILFHWKWLFFTPLFWIPSFCWCCCCFVCVVKKKEVITATVEANRFSQNARKPFKPKCHHTQTHTQCLPIFRVTQSIFFSIANTKKKYIHCLMGLQIHFHFVRVKMNEK